MDKETNENSPVPNTSHSSSDYEQRRRLLRQKENVWRRRHLRLRNDPLSSLIPQGYTSDLWGNNATHRLYFYRVSVMVFLLGNLNDTQDEDEDDIDWDEIIGPKSEECVEGLKDAKLARELVKCGEDAEYY